jgi:phosphatidylethanolamine-binding protein (PEBP) family uncharacterized protein
MASSKQVAIVLIDTDNADFVHWVIWGIPSTVRSLPAGVPSTTYSQATNEFGNVGYAAPCVQGGLHTYVVTLYELEAALTLPAGSPAADVLADLDTESTNSVTVSGRVGS